MHFEGGGEMKSYGIPCLILALLLAGVLYVPMKRYFAGQDLLK